jgi:N-methylhydantoinase A
MKELFFDTYQQLFDRRITEVSVEALTWRLYATGPVPNVNLHFAGQPLQPRDPLKGARDVYFLDSGFVSCPVYDRYALQAGARICGPAVVEERESTTVVGPDAQVAVDKYLNLIMDID